MRGKIDRPIFLLVVIKMAACSSAPTEPNGPMNPLFPLHLCAHCSPMSTDALCLPVPLSPLSIRVNCASVFTVPHSSSVLILLLSPQFLCVQFSFVPTVPLYPLFLCVQFSSMFTVPLCSLSLCAHC